VARFFLAEKEICEGERERAMGERVGGRGWLKK
jgi:hypothetical protein